MRALFIVFLFVFCTVGPCMAAGKTVTYYLDGAKVGVETAYGNGYSEIHLPKGFLEDSLRIRPSNGAEIERVEIRRDKTDSRAEKEIIALAERRNRLVDRLKALETREEIFKAAAKSQSSRVPRKTKNNPEPVTSIRRGTEFAIEQLETVYAIRRKTENEIALLDARLSSLQGTNGSEGFLCKIWFSGNSGRAHISYLTAELKWKPAYDLRLNKDGLIKVVMRAVFPCSEKNCSVKVVPSKLSDAVFLQIQPLALSKPFEKTCEFTFPVEKQVLSDGPVSSLTFTFRNLSDYFLPAGDAVCYLKGEYLGHGPFKGMMPNESGTMSFGNMAGK
jgi:hypothetical protein